MSTATTHIKTEKQLVPALRFKEFEGDWNNKQLKEICSFFSGGTPTSSNKEYYNGDIPFIGSGNIFDSNVSNFITEEALNSSSAKIVEVGDLLYALYGANSGEVGISKMSGAINQAILCIRTESEKIDFIHCLLVLNKDKIVGKYLQGGQGNLSADIVKKLKYHFPSLPEQQKIASFLSGVDEKIQQLTKKKELLEQYKKGGLQQLFSGQLRFKDENGNLYPDWEEKRLGDYLIKHSEITTENDQYPVLTSSRRGLFFQKDYFNGQDVASKDTTGYNVVPRDYFTYRHMSDDLEFKFNINTICDRGIVSTLYPVFTTKDSLDDAFLILKLNNGDEFKRYAILQKQGGSRTYMYFKKLENLVVSLPSIEEQQKIATYLSSIDTKIESVNNQITQTQTFKKGLLQQMFV